MEGPLFIVEALLRVDTSNDIGLKIQFVIEASDMEAARLAVDPREFADAVPDFTGGGYSLEHVRPVTGIRNISDAVKSGVADQNIIREGQDITVRQYFATQETK
jgi:hypothetical protein